MNNVFLRYKHNEEHYCTFWGNWKNVESKKSHKKLKHISVQIDLAIKQRAKTGNYL